MCKLVFARGWKCNCDFNNAYFPNTFIRTCDIRDQGYRCLPSRDFAETSNVPWICPKCHKKVMKEQIAPMFLKVSTAANNLTDLVLDHIPVEEDTHSSELPLRDEFQHQAEYMKLGAYELARKFNKLRSNAYHHYLGNWEWEQKTRQIAGHRRVSFKEVAVADAYEPFREVQSVVGQVGLFPPLDPRASADFVTLPPYLSLTHTAAFPPFPSAANRFALGRIAAREDQFDPEYTERILFRYIESLQLELNEIRTQPIAALKPDANLAKNVSEGVSWNYTQGVNKAGLDPSSDQVKAGADEAKLSGREKGQMFYNLAKARHERGELVKERIPWLENWLKIVTSRQGICEMIEQQFPNFLKKDDFQSFPLDEELENLLTMLNVMNLQIVSQGIRAMHLPAYAADRSRRVRIEFVSKGWIDEVVGNWNDLQEVYLDVDADTPLADADVDYMNLNYSVEAEQAAYRQWLDRQEQRRLARLAQLRLRRRRHQEAFTDDENNDEQEQYTDVEEPEEEDEGHDDDGGDDTQQQQQQQHKRIVKRGCVQKKRKSPSKPKTGRIQQCSKKQT